MPQDREHLLILFRGNINRIDRVDIYIPTTRHECKLILSFHKEICWSPETCLVGRFVPHNLVYCFGLLAKLVPCSRSSFPSSLFVCRSGRKAKRDFLLDRVFRRMDRERNNFRFSFFRLQRIFAGVFPLSFEWWFTFGTNRFNCSERESCTERMNRYRLRDWSLENYFVFLE